VQQKSWQSERRSATPTGGLADTLPDTLDDTPKSLDQERHLCTELVVPDDSECRLFLPDLKENKMSDVLSIDGVNGMAVLYASYTIADRPPAGEHELPGSGKRLILRSALKDCILASCKDVEPETAGSPSQLAILSKSEELFGILRATSPGPRGSYMVSLSTGKKTYIRSDIQAVSSWVTDEDGELLACSEDAGGHGRTICISPQVDAGLMTLTMLAIDVLDVTMAARGSSSHSFR